MTEERDEVREHLRWAQGPAVTSKAAIENLTQAVIALVLQVGAVAEQLALLNEKVEARG